MTKLIFLTLCILFGILQECKAQEVKTVIYFQNDTIKLEMDVYLPKSNKSETTPIVLFAHGGGFSGGDRSSAKEFCTYLAKNGYAAATMSYTLYMKNKKFSCDGVLTEKLKAFQIGASEMWQATRFLLTNSKQYNIDVSKIFIAGISAGAEIGFHAAYWDYKTMNLLDTNLPSDFKYAGFIGGSGAIMDLNLITKNNVIPMFLAHGSADVTVPYATASHHLCPANSSGWLMLFGSHSVYEKTKEMNVSTIELLTFCGGGHEFSGYLFEKEPHYVLQFIKDVLGKTKVQTHFIQPTVKNSNSDSSYSFCN